MNLFSANRNLTRETKIIIAAMALLPLLRYMLISVKGKIYAPQFFYIMAGVLVGMLFMHLHDIRKYRKE